MKKLTIFMTIFVVFLTGCLLYMGLMTENRIKDYMALENDMIEIAKSYVVTDQVSLVSGESIQIKLDKIIEDKFLENNKVNDDTCDGFVTIKRVVDNYTYKPYIKCNNYETLVD